MYIMKRRKRNFFWLTPFLFGTFSNFFPNSAIFFAYEFRTFCKIIYIKNQNEQIMYKINIMRNYAKSRKNLRCRGKQNFGLTRA